MYYIVLLGNNKKWGENVEMYQKKWHSTIMNVVLDKCKRPLLVVKYEDIRRNRIAEVSIIYGNTIS